MRQPKQAQFAPRLSLQRLTSNSYGLKSLLEKAKSHLSLTDLFNQSVSDLFKNKFHVNGIKGQILILTCHSATLMTRLRFHEEEIINNFNQKISPKRINAIKVKIRPQTVYNKQALSKNTEDMSEPSLSQNNVLSKKNAQLLIEEAEHTNDAKLKNILLQLAKHIN